MAVPNFETIMLPALQYLGDGETRTRRQVREAVTTRLEIDPSEAERLLPSGRSTVMQSRTGWAITYLHQAQLIERVQRGAYRITARGRNVLADPPDRIDIEFLERFPEFMVFRAAARGDSPASAPATGAVLPAATTPEEELERAVQRLRQELEAELLLQLHDVSPAGFERLVVRVLVAMGYGGDIADAGRAVGRSGDGGIDGIIKEDPLGLDLIYVQAKRWENTVGRPEIQKFAGALQGHRARKGIFITTAAFSSEAKEYVERIEARVILIDGRGLARLMFDHEVGVTTVGRYDVRRLDTDFFNEE